MEYKPILSIFFDIEDSNRVTKKVYEEIQRNFVLLIYFPTNLNKVEVDAQTKSLRLYNEMNDQMLPGYCTAYLLLNNVRHFNFNFWRKYPDDLKF